MSAKLTTRQVGDVTVIDAAGRITLGEGSSVFRDTIRDLSSNGNRKLLLNLADVTLYRQFGHRGDGVRIYERNQSGRPVEAPQPDQARERPVADHKAVHGFRGL